jgi:hypothetical protein
MAIAFSVLAASAHSLRYLAIADGAGQDNTLTQAQLIADAVEGPLKAKLLSSPIQGVSTPANNAWGALVADPTLSVHVAPGISSPALIGYTFGVVGPGTVHTLICDAAGAGKVVIEIRFNHTLDR